MVKPQRNGRGDDVNAGAGSADAPLRTRATVVPAGMNVAGEKADAGHGDGKDWPVDSMVRDVMTTRVIAVDQGADYKKIAHVLCTYRVSACPVVSGRGAVVGVVSEADLLSKPAAPDFPAGLTRLRWKLEEESKAAAITAERLMTSPAVTISPDAPVAVAARVMQDRCLKRLPVVDEDNKLIGIISRADVLSVYERPDSEILGEVNQAVAREPRLDSDVIDVGIAAGVVTLSGSVAGEGAALELTARIRHIEGVVAVRDRLLRREERRP